jgi:hypothetical protein
MTSERAVKQPAMGQGHEPLTKRLKRLWILLTTEKVFREDGASTRTTRVRRAIRS